MSQLPKNITDSHSPFVAEFIFNNGSRGAKNILPQQYLQSMELTLKGDSGWTGKVVFFDEHGGALENLVLTSGEERTLQFRFGWDNTGGIAKQPQWIGKIIRYVPVFTAEGVELTFEMVDKVIGTTVATKEVRKFKENMTASDIFKEIANARGWATQDEFGPTVEDCEYKITTPMSTDNESDIRFIREQLIPLTNNQDGKGFQFYVDRDNIAHFHSRDFLLVTGSRSRHIAADYLCSKDAMGEVISFAPSDNLFESILQGGGEAEVSGVDSLKGTLVKKTSRANQGPDNVKLTLKNDAQFTPEKPKGTHYRGNVVCRTPEELETKFKSQWTLLQQSTFKADLAVRGTHAVRLYDYVNVRYLKRDGQQHYMSGVFLTNGVQHTIDSGGWKTDFKLIREGTKQTQGAQRLQGNRETVEVNKSKTQVTPNVQAPNDDGQSQATIRVQPGTGANRRT